MNKVIQKVVSQRFTQFDSFLF